MRITRSDLYMAYLDEHVEECRLQHDDVVHEVTDAAGELLRFPGSNKLFRSLMRTSMAWACQLHLGTCQGQVALR